MVTSLIFTGFGTLAIGLLPTYSNIGMWSTVLFIMLRIFQNFFTGIEYINSATYLIESSSENTRGYYASWTAVGISGGYLLASLVTLTISTLIVKKILPDWSWRLVFLFSIFGVIFGFWLRKSIPESLTFILTYSNTDKNSKFDILSNSLRHITRNPVQSLSISAITLMGIFLSYLYYIYIPINLITSRHFTNIQVYSINSVSLLIIVLLIPFWKISDYLIKLHC